MSNNDWNFKDITTWLFWSWFVVIVIVVVCVVVVVIVYLISLLCLVVFKKVSSETQLWLKILVKCSFFFSSTSLTPLTSAALSCWSSQPCGQLFYTIFGLTDLITQFYTAVNFTCSHYTALLQYTWHYQPQLISIIIFSPFIFSVCNFTVLFLDSTMFIPWLEL